MRLFLLVLVIMCAFAGNSILNRVGVAGYGMDPMVFGLIRVAAGAAVLLALVRVQGRALPLRGLRRVGGAVSLAAYMICFSWAYLSLGAGLGALILFGTVQGVMFAFAVWRGQAIPAARWLGMAVAFAGLVLLLWPAGVVQVPLAGAVSMIVAGAGWAVYTLLGQGEADATAATAANFLLCLPLMALAMVAGQGGALPVGGAMVAVLAGAVTSGLGYALWYRVLPQLAVTVAAIAQLSVPVIAVAAGIALLGEPMTPRLALAGLLVLGGIAVSVLRRR